MFNLLSSINFSKFTILNAFIIWLFNLERWKKRLIQIIFDVLAVIISMLLAFYIRFDTIDFLYKFDTYISLLIAVFIIIPFFITRGLYKTFTRRVSIEVANSIILGSIISCLFLLMGILLLELEIPRSVPMIYLIILCNFTTSIRFFVRAIGRDIDQKIRKNITIYGLGASGIELLDALIPNPNYKICQFIDDNPEIQGQIVEGIPIESFKNAKKKFKTLEIDTLLITMSSGAETIRQRLLDTLSEYKIDIKIIPSIKTLIEDDYRIDQFRNLNIEDLLGRKPVIPDSKLMAQNISNKTVLVTGAGGSIGSELCRQISQWSPKKIILLDVSEFAIYKLMSQFEKQKLNLKIDIVPLVGSVQDNNFIKKIMMSFDIDTIYHAAAYKHVPLMEKNVMQCVANNIFGTLNVAKNAISAGVNNFILVSTDKAVNPTNFMGVSKRIAEIICQTLPTKKSKICFSVVRFGNVLGSSGSVVPLFTDQINKGGPITLTHPEVTRYFMTIPEAAQLLIQAGSMEQHEGVFVLDMGKPIKIRDLVEKMAVLAGLKPIMTDHKNLKNDEIAISVTGLRAGEKLYEELSYDANLKGTNHPRIMITKETVMTIERLNVLLERINSAYNNNNYTELFEVMSSISHTITNIKESEDPFIYLNKKV